MTEEKKMILVRSTEGKLFEVAQEAALQCETIKNMIEDGCTPSEKGIPLPNVSSKTLSKVIKYLIHHMENRKGNDGEEEERKAVTELQKWDEEFVNVDMETLVDIALAANYLNVKNLLDMTSMAIANHIKDLRPEEVREIFAIENDFSPEEEANVREQNKWAFE
ncbi:hypothetical protein AMTRI_Chr07g25620 [Amborella trichopoda]